MFESKPLAGPASMQSYPARVPKYLVTGANGILGCAVLRQLAIEGGVSLRAAVRSERAAQQVRALGTGAEIVLLSKGRPEGWRGALDEIDAVVHTIGILKESPRSRYRDAHEGSVSSLCEAVSTSRCRRVVYLSIVGAAPASSNACLASKGRAEQILLSALPTSLVLRFPMVIGAGDPASVALRARATQRRAWLLGGGRARDQPVDARDAINAITRAMRTDTPTGVIELAGPEALPYRELVRRVADRLGENPRISSIPAALARAAAWVSERALRHPPLTLAMLDVLLQDDAIEAEPAWDALGLKPRALDESLDYWFGEGGA